MTIATIAKRFLAYLRYYGLAVPLGWSLRAYTNRLKSRGVLPSVQGIAILICAGSPSELELRIGDALKSYLDTPPSRTGSFRQRVRCVRVTDKLATRWRFAPHLKTLDLSLAFVQRASSKQIVDAFTEAAAA